MTPDAVTLLHLLGFLTGIVLYAMLGVMSVRATTAHAAPGGTRDRIPLVTAILGLTWNVGALVIYGFRDFGVGSPSSALGAVAFSALGFLPAVVVDSALQTSGRQAPARALRRTAYTLSAIAALLQCGALALGQSVPSRSGLLVLSVGYGALMVFFMLQLRRQPGWQRALPAVALAVFAVMAFHLGQHTAASDTLWVELVGHHASIPLALVILYQDYRFALVDLFLKRAITLLVLILVGLALYTGLAAPYILPRLERDPTSPLGVSALLALWVVAALAYPPLRLAIARFVDRVLLRRPDYRLVRATLSARVAGLDTDDAVLDAVCLALARGLSAGRVAWESTEAVSTEPWAVDETPEGEACAARIVVPTVEAPSWVLSVHELSGGRRMLSDDLTLLEAAALIAARRIDALRVSRERHARDVREGEMRQLATEAELRALRAQLDPHFLFNALATIGYLMREAPDRALDTLYRLTALLRSVLRPATRELVALRDEVQIVEAYLAIERARFEERLEVVVRVPPELADTPVPPLLLQPLVENAVTHGIAPLRSGGSVLVEARLEEPEQSPQILRLIVSDTGAGAHPAAFERGRTGRVGLRNVEQRLERLYGDRASLELDSAPGRGTTATIRLPVRRAAVRTSERTA